MEAADYEGNHPKNTFILGIDDWSESGESSYR